MKYITAAATLKCCHQGRVLLLAGMSRIKIDGGEVVTREALVGAPILGCTNIGPGLVPCTAVVSVLAGPSPGVRVGGLTPLVEAATGLTNGSPPGVWKVEKPGQDKVVEGSGGGSGGRSEEPIKPPHVSTALTRDNREPRWEKCKAKLGDTGVATWKPHTADGGSAEVIFWEHLPGEKRWLGSVRADAQKGKAEWVVSYPASGPSRPTSKPYAEVFFEVRTAAGVFQSPRTDGQLLQVRAELRFQVTDPDGKPLAQQQCLLAPLGRTPQRMETDAEGLVWVENIHPGAPGLFLTGRHGQMVLADDGTWAEEQVCRVPNYAAVNAALKLGLQNLKELEAELARKEAEEARLAMEEMLEANEEESDDWALTKNAAAGAVVASGALLADDVTLLGTVDDAAIPFVWAGIGLLAVGNAVYVVVKQPWRKEKSRNRAERVRRINIKRLLNRRQPTPQPPVPIVPPTSLESVPPPTEQSEPQREPLAPPFPAPEPAPNSRRRRQKLIPLRWPYYYLPAPPGWSSGGAVFRSVVPARLKRGSATNQKHVNTLIRFATRFANKAQLEMHWMFDPTATLLLKEEVRRAQRYSKTHDLLQLPNNQPDKAFAEQVKRLPREVFDVPRLAVQQDLESFAWEMSSGGLNVRFDAHHIVPLYFADGTESFENLCILDYEAHEKGHKLLRYQPHWNEHGLHADISRHPLGITYRLEFTYDRWNVLTDLNPWEEDPEESDYQHRWED